MTDLVTRIDSMSDGEVKGVEAEREPRLSTGAWGRGRGAGSATVRVFGNLRELAKEEPSAPRS